MKNLTDDVPKCLLKIEGRPLIEWQINAMREAGIDEIGIVTGYKREALSSYGLVEFHNDKWQETNMVSSLSCADEWLKSSACVVSYSDIFYDSSAVSSLKGSPAEVGITFDPNWLNLWANRFDDPLSDAETFRIDRDNTLLEIGGRASSVDEIQGQYMGLLRITPKGWVKIQEVRSGLPDLERNKLQMTHLLQKLIAEDRCQISAIPYLGKWGEFDSADDIVAYAS
ncbi:putative sugar nucleotidyltransferase [Micavibrio aeruginosavorus ARL-13]|uniref:Putative sugar nucleotidyltransferase n=2 Tax=Micavibrio aeruginosavorus TaxID=349221 RepID=G2KLW6_MICAA|nr:putative sugar nucleotidyltransferase [Micavibrio aeruginosavorus ARL-13]